MMAVNLDGVFNTASATIPAMLRSARPGRFVAVASAASTRGLPLMGAYAAAKHGVLGLVRSLAADLADTGITANAVAPGSTTTNVLEASAAAYDLTDSAEFIRHHPIGRLLEPSEVASAIGWLCSESTAAVTGAVLAVDGGMTAL
jgi:NAD(P)-dependent dehydrogenase (short-subunit alcohol dehydrogenase family)